MNSVATKAWWSLGLALHVCLVSELKADPLRIGAAQVNITPPIGVPMAGYYHERGASAIHDDLFARCIVLEKDGVKAAIVSLDLITTRRSLVQDARRLIESSTDIPGDHVMISATHAHTGPVLASDSTLDEARGGKDELVLQYSRTLPAFIADSVVKANAVLGSSSSGGDWSGRQHCFQPAISHEGRFGGVESGQEE